MKNERITEYLIFLVCFLLTLAVALGATARRVVSATVYAPPHILVDAGHGGADGGAVAADGTLEKDINLKIARSLADFLRLAGFRVTETRTEDTMVGDGGNTMRERKVSDIRFRAKQSETADVTVSIHQNKFEQSRYSGAQFFYAAVSGSQELAEVMRETVTRLLQPENTRELKAGGKDIYLLAHAVKPTVLAECGFLSNETEREKLKTEDYQKQMALAIGAGLITWQKSR